MNEIELPIDGIKRTCGISFSAQEKPTIKISCEGNKVWFLANSSWHFAYHEATITRAKAAELEKGAVASIFAGIAKKALTFLGNGVEFNLGDAFCFHNDGIEVRVPPRVVVAEREFFRKCVINQTEKIKKHKEENRRFFATRRQLLALCKYVDDDPVLIFESKRGKLIVNKNVTDIEVDWPRNSEFHINVAMVKDIGNAYAWYGNDNPICFNFNPNGFFYSMLKERRAMTLYFALLLIKPENEED